MKITVKLEIEKETGEVYRVESEGTCTEELGTIVVNFGDHRGISIKNSLPHAVLDALTCLPGAWMPTDLDRFAENAASISAGEQAGLISREEIESMIADAVDIHEAKKHMSDAVYGPVKSFEEPADTAEIGRAVTDAIGDGRNFGVQPSADDAPADRLSEIEQKRVLTVRKYVEHSNLSQAYLAELRKGVRYVGGVGWTPKEAAAHLFIDLLEHERVFADMTGIEYVEETDE